MKNCKKIPKIGHFPDFFVRILYFPKRPKNILKINLSGSGTQQGMDLNQMHMQNLQQQQQQFQHQLQQQQLQHQHSMSGFMHPSMQGIFIMPPSKKWQFNFWQFLLGINDRMYIWILVPFPFPLFPGFPGANPGAFPNPLANMPPFPIPQDMSGSALSQIISLLSPRIEVLGCSRQK